jgi:SAM-dependent methyltransferase
MERQLQGNWYDFPQYYGSFFRKETAREVQFIEKVLEQLATIPVKTLVELGCGGGRLSLALARRGYRVYGVDCNPRALAWFQQRAERQGLTAYPVLGDLANFTLPESVELAVCTFNTFRHLLSEQAARRHLTLLAEYVRPGGLYILGFHLLPLDVAEEDEERWSARLGWLRLHARLRVERMDRRKRREWLRLVMTVRGPRKRLRLESRFAFRIYTREQFLRLLQSVPAWQLVSVFDFWYDWRHPRQLDDRLTDAVFVLRRRE